jgi:hypothetical protein
MLTSVTYTGCEIWWIEYCITEKISVISPLETERNELKDYDNIPKVQSKDSFIFCEVHYSQVRCNLMFRNFFQVSNFFKEILSNIYAT